MFKKVKNRRFEIVVEYVETLVKGTHLISPITGIIHNIEEILPNPDDPQLFYFRAIVNTPPIGRVQTIKRATAAGASICKERALVRTIGEAVERYCGRMGWFYHKRRMIYSSYKKIKDDAINPEDLIMYSEKQYLQPGFKLHKFSGDLEIWWIKGYSLVKNRSIFVPASFVFLAPMHVMCKKPQEFINVPISTGLACGNSKGEAILSGLYECVERDAFTIMWLNKLSMPLVQLDSVKNRELQETLKKIYSANIEVYVSNITTDLGIPTLFTILKSRVCNKYVPAACVSACTTLNPEVALLHSLEEACLVRLSLRTSMEKNSHINISTNSMKKKNVGDDIFDHARLYSKKEMLPALKFLTDSHQKNMIEKIKNKSSGEPSKDLQTCLDILARKKFDVILVDVTIPSISKVGFFVVKVIIPGLQPLQFFPLYQCLKGPRVYTLPKILGHAIKNTENSINPYPHPFG